jgi:hypothetical protein
LDDLPRPLLREQCSRDGVGDETALKGEAYTIRVVVDQTLLPQPAEDGFFLFSEKDPVLPVETIQVQAVGGTEGQEYVFFGQGGTVQGLPIVDRRVALSKALGVAV